MSPGMPHIVVHDINIAEAQTPRTPAPLFVDDALRRHDSFESLEPALITIVEELEMRSAFDDLISPVLRVYNAYKLIPPGPRLERAD
jgi:hypothetical protein